MSPPRREKSRAEKTGLSQTLRAAMRLLPAVAIATAVALLCCACASSPPASAPLPSYEILAEYDGGREVTLRERVRFYNDTGDDLCELVFRLCPNAFSEDAQAQPYLPESKDDFFYAGESFGGIEVSYVKYNGQNIDFVICGQDDSIMSVPAKIGKGETAAVEIYAEVLLPECNSRFGVTERGVNLTGFYPMLSVYDDGWRKDGYAPVGDPFFSEASDYSLTAVFPQKFSAAASGVTEIREKDGARILTATADGVRDIALFLSESFATATRTVALPSGRTEVIYHYISDPDPDASLSLAADALAVFSELFGEYPYPTLTLVRACIGAGGMEYGALAAVDAELTGNEFRHTLVHEIAHQWWFGAVGSDQINEPWLDEGLAEFSTAYYMLLREGEEAYRSAVRAAETSYSVFARLPETVGFDRRMSRPLSSYLTNGEYVAVVYAEGLILFDTLMRLAGRERTENALASLYSSCLFGIASPDDLAAAFDSAGFAAAPLIESFREGTAAFG